MPPTDRPERPHDVLAAELFAMPTVDPDLHHGPVRLPADPSGIDEAHDVLAAEEFAIPAPRRPGSAGAPSRRSTQVIAAAAALVALLVVVRMLRRR